MTLRTLPADARFIDPVNTIGHISYDGMGGFSDSGYRNFKIWRKQLTKLMANNEQVNKLSISNLKLSEIPLAGSLARILLVDYDKDHLKVLMMILEDEADFFRKGEQEEVRHVSKRYIGKSDPYIVMISTPNNPGGLFYQIEQEPEDACLYKRLKMDYHYGLSKIYIQEEIDRASQSSIINHQGSI